MLDSSAIIEFKSITTPEIERRVLTLLDQLVLQRKISFPRQVRREVSGDGQNDLPALWALRNFQKILLNKSPEERYITNVLNKVPNLVEEDNTKDAADPYVLALALQLKDNDFNAIVVTEDRVDRLPRKRSLKSACEIMGVEVCLTRDFFDRIGLFQTTNAKQSIGNF